MTSKHDDTDERQDERRDGHGAHKPSNRKMGAAVLLTFAFVIAEAICGWLGNSLALLSDAGHNLADAFALGLSWYAIWIAKRKSNSSMTFGYHRVGILAALVNALSLVVIALLIFWEAADRLRHLEPANGWLMSGVAVVSIAVNVVISVWLRAGAKHDINIRSAYLHMVGDALSSFGVVIAGVIVAVSQTTVADPIVSILIGLLIFWSSWGVLKESLNVFLEGTPAGLDVAALIVAIKNVPAVLDVHDLHLWTVGPGVIACSFHVVVEEQSVRQGQQVIRAVTKEMKERFAITHTTIQVEVEGCGPNEMYCCVIPRSNEGTHHH